MAGRSIRSGELRHSLELQAGTNSADSGGGRTVSWATSHTLYCSIDPVGDSEFVEGDRVNSRTTHLIKTRTDSSLSFTDQKRLKFGTRIFNIVSVRKPDEVERSVLIEAEEEGA